jgi:hypothetical protein
MNPLRQFNPEKGSTGPLRTPEKPVRSQEEVAEGSRTIAEHAPRALVSAQRGYTNKLKGIVKKDLELRGQSMPANAEALFDKGFRTNPDIPAERSTLERTRVETVTAVLNTLKRGELSAKDISPSEAIAPITIDGQTLTYPELIARVEETLSVSSHGKKLQKILEESSMSGDAAAKAIGELAAAVARAKSIGRFVGSDTLGVRSSNEKLQKKNPPRPQPPAPPKHLATLEQALQSAGAKKEAPTKPTLSADEARKQAYEVLGEMAKQSGAEVPIRIGGKTRSVSLIISPRHERDAEDKPVEGGDEWFEIKRAFHVLEPKGKRTEKQFEPTNLKNEGVPNGLVVRTPEDMPEAIMDGMSEWGITMSKEDAFTWMIVAGKDGAQRWRERMHIDDKKDDASAE